MGKSAPSAPAAPDPAATAAAQTQSNKETALYQFGLNNPNYNTPLGSLNYTVGNTNPTYDTNAYNTALSAWKSNGGGSTSAPLSIDDWRAQHTGTGGSTSGSAYAQYVNSLGGNGAGGMPQLKDFQTAPGGNPQTTADVTLSPGQQQLYDQNTAQSIGLSTLAGQLQGNVGTALNQPTASSADFNTASKMAQDAYYKNQTQYLDPQFAQGQQQLDAKLANQGLTAGSEAYNNDQNNFARQKQSAYDTAQQNSILQGPQNAQQLFALSTAARDQPLQEFNALRSQSQVQMPSFNATQPTTVAPTNTAAITQQAYQNSLNPYNAQIAANNQTTGGLFGLGGSALGAYGSYLGAAAAASDVRLKENIKYLGQEKGHAIYSFSYISDPKHLKYRGVMAQDVLTYNPDAVIKDGEYYKVNYHKLGVEFARIH